MENKKQYFIVGSFVLLGIGAIIAILLWFSASSRKEYDIYRVVFTEPVDGVTTSSVIKYNGVEVGKVQAISLDNKDPRNVYVDIAVNHGLNITTATYATLKAQGVTGMSYVALNLNPERKTFTTLATHNTPPYPIIPAEPSLLYSLSSQAQSVATNIHDVSGQVKVLLNEQNLQHMTNIIKNMDQVTGAVASQSGSIAKSVAMVSQVLQNVNENTAHLNDAIVQLSELSKALQKNSQSFDGLLNSVQNNTLRNVNTILLPNINQVVTNMNNVTLQFNELVKLINQNPSALVRGKAAPVAGPGE
ncbi:MAG: hypothetical protein RLZZ293_808 [Pseudomonadota bacterium]|jgi:phospholipid/cholesterol/gamma-HCH transport system substrate-binding protein